MLKTRRSKSRSLASSRLALVIVRLMMCTAFLAVLPGQVSANVEVSFLYSLSDFNGTIPYNWVNISVDEERNEVYVTDGKERDIAVFNELGMEIYRFGDDGSLGSVIDATVEKDGHILVLSRRNSGNSIILCNFRGEPLAELELKKFPPDFSDFSPNRLVYSQESLYLLDKRSMKIAVTDNNGLFQKGYDVSPLVGVEQNRLIATEMEGFSVDRKGNMLFTIPVKFSAYRLSPDGKITSFGRRGGGPGRFNVVGGIVADDRGYYYVSDRLKSAVLIFDKDFQFQGEFGYRGSRPGSLIGPKNLALDAEGRLYVSQLRSRGVSVFKITYK
ncbi:MAG: hypothetical protein JSU72_06945 [Deltaproteobacteria bacterium]|nr:MAG: hypothetical protein JSU72_06945 [Deltaproteobacteria bacterium]